MTQTLLKLAADFTVQLSDPVAIADTTAIITSNTDDDNVTLANGLYGFTIDSGQSNKEYIVCTLTGTAISDVHSITRQGASTVGFAKAHRRGAKVTITDWAILSRMLNNLNGTTNFDSAVPLGYDGAPASLTGNQFATVDFLGSVIVNGALDATTSVKGIGRVSVAPVSAATPIFVGDNDPRVPTQSEKDAISGGGAFGTPSSTNKFITQNYTGSIPTITVLNPTAPVGASNTQFDITLTGGTTYRYTYDGTGTDPVINSGTFPIGTVVDIQGKNFTAANNGLFTVTGVGSNYFEITNASGVAENNKTLGIGYLVIGGVYTKPSTLKYLIVELVGGGQAGQGFNTGADERGKGGSSGAYLRKQFNASDLSATENYVVGFGLTGTAATPNSAGRTVFKTLIAGGGTTVAGGSASGGDINISGQIGNAPAVATSGTSGAGADSFMGIGGTCEISATSGASVNGRAATGYGAGGSGASINDGASPTGGNGAQGVIILTEIFN